MHSLKIVEGADARGKLRQLRYYACHPAASRYWEFSESLGVA